SYSELPGGNFRPVRRILARLNGFMMTPLQAQVAAYITRQGIRAFMDEDYNLTGTRVRAVVTEQNFALAFALGLPVTGRALPVAIEKREIWAAIDASRRSVNRTELSRFFTDSSNIPDLTSGQRLYLEWHYLSPNNYRFNLEKLPAQNSVVRLLGWNMET